MDFLNLLLLYLSMTFAIGVQEAPAPVASPEPTQPPAAVLAQQGLLPSQQDDVLPDVTLTPAPTAKPTATPRPEPTITPNKGYTKLELNSRGNQVKKLQERLIELGYLPAGAADGAYGYQTLNAVRDFQKANRLSSDGVAGAATLTHLYEDEYVVYGKLAVTPTPKPQPVQPGETPKPYNPMDAWSSLGGKLKLGAKNLVLTRSIGGTSAMAYPQLWKRADEPMMNLGDMAEGARWSMTAADDGSSCVIAAAGYALVLTAESDVSAGYCQLYACTVDGKPVATDAGDVVWADGKWAVSATFMKNAFGASVIWDSENNTLIVDIPNHATGD